jgi:hypothetical protein
LGRTATGDTLTPVPADQWQRYATDVWCEFLLKSGEPEVRMMSPAEWSVLHGWLRDGVPFRVVLRGFRETRGQGKTLAYYAPAVREAYAHWRAAMGGHAA